MREVTFMYEMPWSKRKTEMFRAEFFVNSNILALETSANGLAARETNDCVVRAFMSALDIPYNQAHAWVKKHMKREDRRGTYTAIYYPNILSRQKNGRTVKWYGSTPSYKWMGSGSIKGGTLQNPRYKNKNAGYTLKAFVADHPEGNFVVIVEGHAVAVCNGKLYANRNEQETGLYRSVHYVFSCN